MGQAVRVGTGSCPGRTDRAGPARTRVGDQALLWPCDLFLAGNHLVVPQMEEGGPVLCQDSPVKASPGRARTLMKPSLVAW